VAVGKLVAGDRVPARATTVNGLATDLGLSHALASVVTAAFPSRHAEPMIGSFDRPTKAQRAAALRTDFQVLHSVRPASAANAGLPLPCGAPLALTVTSVRAGLAPYDPTRENQGIPVEVVRYRPARAPAAGFACQTVVRRHGKVVGFTGSDHAARPGQPGGAPRLLPAGRVGVGAALRTDLQRHAVGRRRHLASGADHSALRAQSLAWPG
jgi:hypothetical protein